jgi:alkaline phosphatase D
MHLRGQEAAMTSDTWTKRTATSALDRRRLLMLTGQGLTAAMTLALLPGDDLSAAPNLGDNPFKLGIASGDPEPDGIVIWTRLAPDPLAEDGHGGMPNTDAPVRWQIATDAGMRNVVAQGTARASRRLGHSVHVEVYGLRPGRHYFYRFSYRGEESPVGRTMTAPALGARLDRLSFAYASCQDWPSGFYNAYRFMAEEDIDLVFHLGDYIYEGGVPADGGARKTPVPPALQTQAMDLAGFRLLHALYKTDPDLQEAHRRFPFVCIWDDHEVENDYGGPFLQDGSPSLGRRAAAYQAFYEHLPLRAISIPTGPDMRIFRRLVFGDLVTFNVLDTRQYRSGHPCGQGEAPRCDAAFDRDTTILGDLQEDWLVAGLTQSRTRWNVVAQQVLMAQLDHDLSRRQRFWLDAWDPYVRDRQRLLNLFHRGKVRNPVIITGDWHSTFANNLKLDFDDERSPTVAAEFVTPAITSGGDGQPYGPYYGPMIPANPHIKYFEGDKRGYFRARLTRRSWETDVRYVSRVERQSARVFTGASFVVEDGVPGLQSISVFQRQRPWPAQPQGLGRVAGL